MVELHLAKVVVEGSNPFARSNFYPLPALAIGKPYTWLSDVRDENPRRGFDYEGEGSPRRDSRLA